MNGTLDRKMKVFLCHAPEDNESAKDLRDLLDSHGVDVWLDSEKLLPGQTRSFEISEAVRSSDVVIVCISLNSLDKEGYVQKEIRLALDVADEKPEGTIFLIPARLEECTVPRRLAGFQPVDLFEKSGYAKLLEALRVRAAKIASKRDRERVIPPVAPKKAAFIPPKILLPFDLDLERDFIKIPAGEFWMGSQVEEPFADPSEKPQFGMKIPYDFWLARFPVTNYQFQVFLQQTDHAYKLPNNPELYNHPVVNVNWKQAAEYCQWLTKSFRQKLVQDYIFKLPSEAEWELAARGPLPSRRKNPRGSHWSTVDLSFCNSIEEEVNGTTIVGAYSLHGDSFYQIADMAGNVREWTRSTWGFSQDYPDMRYTYGNKYGSDIESPEDSEKLLKIARGGSFMDSRESVTCSHRYRLPPSTQDRNLGFRVAITPILPSVASKPLNISKTMKNFIKQMPLTKKKTD
jgi:formylglycine-generating enzyme required for sulfatase activity